MGNVSKDHLIYAHGAINRGELAYELGQLAAAGDAAGLDELLEIVVERNPGTFHATYPLFEPVMMLLDRHNTAALRSGLDPDAVVRKWAQALDLASPAHMTAMLAMNQAPLRAHWIMGNGGDPNAIIDRLATESLTIIGRACRVSVEEDEIIVLRSMIQTVLKRGEVPYSVKPRYPGDPEGCNLMRAVMTNIDNAGRHCSVILDAVGEAAREGYLALGVQQALGEIFLSSEDLTTYESMNMSKAVNYWPLSMSRFSQPGDWKTAVGNVTRSAGLDSLFWELRSDILKRLLENMALDAVGADDVDAYATPDQIHCTLLQAAALKGKEHAVRLLLEAGADPTKKLDAESETHKIAGLDATGLWHTDSARQPSQALSAWKAKQAIGEVLRQRSANARA